MWRDAGFSIFLSFFFPEKNVFFFGNFFLPSGSSAFFRPHFCNSHEYHPYSSNWYPNFLWNFTSKSRVKVRLAIFSKKFRLFLDFCNLHIKPNVLNLTFFRQKMNPRKIAVLWSWQKNLKEIENPVTRHIPGSILKYKQTLVYSLPNYISGHFQKEFSKKNHVSTVHPRLCGHTCFHSYRA